MYKILIVDDDPNNRFTLRTIIKENVNANIVKADSGEVSLKYLITDTFDLIILDIQMPGMDGFETAKLIKSRKKTMNIPIIFLTAAYLNDEYKEKGFEIGAVDYLTKPVDDYLLINRIKVYLDIIEKERNLNLKLQKLLKVKIDELHNSEERYSILFQNNYSVMLLTDSETGRIVDVNPAAVNMYGYSEEILKTMTIYDINISLSDRVLSEMQDAKHKHKNYFLSKHKLYNGTIRDVEIQCRPVEINNKTYLYSVITDITEKLLNEMLKKKLSDIDIINKSNTNFQNLLDQYLECFIDIHGVDFSGIYMIDSDTSNLKYKPSSNISDTFLEMIASHCYTKEILLLLRSGNPYYIENIPDDDDVWSNLNKEGIMCLGIIPIINGDKLLGMLNIGSINEKSFSLQIKKLLEIIANKVCDSILRFNSENRAKEIEQRWKFAIEGNGHVVCEWHVNKGFMKISENANELFEYDVSEIIKKENNFNSLLPQDDLLDMQGKIEHLDSDEQYFFLEHRIIANNDKIKWVLNRGMFLKDSMGKNSKILLITLTEITHIKNLQSELITAKEAAEAANEAKSDFLANMSHEIRNPMTGIIGLTDLTLLSDLSESDRKNLKIVMHSAMSLLTIINDILDYSKIEAGKTELDEKPLFLRSMLEEIFKLFDVSAKKKNIALSLTVADDVPNVILGDKTRITQVLSNLISNAIKFTKIGHVHIVVTQIHIDKAPPALRFCVEDTGIGIPEDKIKLLFKRFSQVDSSNTKQFGGTGLGLAISKKLAELMGGEIIVKSTAGIGSKFIFTTLLNIPDIILTTPEPIRMDEPIPNINPSEFKILVAEDDEISSTFIERILELNGYQYKITKNGQEAVKAFKSNPYDLILMDIQMPVMNGITATKLIRELDKNIPIISMTAYALAGDREKCLEAGMNEYITKPNVINFMCKTLDKWLMKS